jgi:hypothetical protein
MLSPKLIAELGHAGIQAWQVMHSSVIKIAIGSPFCLPARPVSQGSPAMSSLTLLSQL